MINSRYSPARNSGATTNPKLAALLFGLVAFSAHGVSFSETTYQGRDQFLIKTEQATYYFDRAGGGFSRLVDRDGRDWIDFSKDPLKSYPASAAAGYRGLPNLVFGSQNPDAGAGHPGFNQCESVLIEPDTIRTTSKSKKWQWSWRFRDDGATFTMEQTDPEHPWWFLYEGPIAGSFQPTQKYWATDTIGTSTEIPDNQNQLFGQWQWVYFGDLKTPRVLYLVQHEPDTLPDTLWYLGSSNRGSATAPDGMMVFGFGRGPGTKPQFQSAGVKISLGFLNVTPRHNGPPISPEDHQRLSKQISTVPAPKE